MLDFWSNASYLDGYLLTNFGGIIERITSQGDLWPDCKPEIEFKYGGRLFSETESTNAIYHRIWSGNIFRPTQMSDVTKPSSRK